MVVNEALPSIPRISILTTVTLYSNNKDGMDTLAMILILKVKLIESLTL